MPLPFFNILFLLLFPFLHGGTPSEQVKSIGYMNNSSPRGMLLPFNLAGILSRQIFRDGE